MVAVLLIPTLGFAVWVLAEAGDQSKIDSATFVLAGDNARSSITAITGTEHTVYHANESLVEPRAHRTDRRITLVWFTRTTCSTCEGMLFVHTVMQDFRQSAVFVEKELEREPGAERLGVTTVPTFVWLDNEGNELGRFTSVGDEAAFRAEILKVLGPTD
jgi:thioredoxin-related protein